MNHTTGRRLSIFVVTAALVSADTVSQAQPIPVPSDLDPGDPYRLAFVTSTARDGTSSNIADYNAFVTGVANTVTELAALGAGWTAIVSTDAVDAVDNTDTRVFVSPDLPIYSSRRHPVQQLHPNVGRLHLPEPIGERVGRVRLVGEGMDGHERTGVWQRALDSGLR
jgi:hypothetical protein